MPGRARPINGTAENFYKWRCDRQTREIVANRQISWRRPRHRSAIAARS